MAARLSRLGARCIALTIFTAPAPSGVPLSKYAQGLHTSWESARDSATDEAINETRREEERQAMRLLGLEHVWLDLPDAPYRRSAAGDPFYTSDAQLMGRVAAEERHGVVPYIAEQIRRVAEETGLRGRVRVFAPLGVGHHVDHQLAYLATRRLPPRYGLAYYEDYPYAAKQGALLARLQELDLPMQGRIVSISELLGVKIAAIARYKSQLPVLFGSSDAMPAAVRAYTQTVAAAGGSTSITHAERFWFFPPSYALGE